MLTCQDCTGLTLYQEPATPAPDPRVQITQTVTSGLVSAFKFAMGAQAAVDISGIVADAGKTVIVPGADKKTESVQTVRPEVVTVNQPEPVIVEQPPAQVVTQPEPTIVKPTIVEPTIVEPAF
jgi:hypothetical protein